MLHPATPEQFNFRFSAGREFRDKLERLAEVLGVHNPAAHMAELLEQALDAALDKKDPQRRLARRRAREAKRTRDVAEAKPRPDEVLDDHNEDATTSRHVPVRVQDRVQTRAGYQCEYRGSDGTRCTARTSLEIEHERPFALHKNHDERFLRLFCRAHNRLAAERVYGAAFIRAKIEASRRRPAQPSENDSS